jgi:hypothetical protein
MLHASLSSSSAIVNYSLLNPPTSLAGRGAARPEIAAQNARKVAAKRILLDVLACQGAVLNVKSLCRNDLQEVWVYGGAKN